MTNYRNPKYLERYEDVYFQLETALDNPQNGIDQRKTGHTFVVDNSGESNPFDWYHARFNVNFKLQLLADGGNIGANVPSGIVNQAINIKNLLEYSRGYSESQGKNEFFHLDTIRNNGLNKLEYAEAGGHGRINATYNKGFAVRHALLVDNAVVNAEIPLNRYSFFESLHGEILPNSRLDIQNELESDNDLVWRTGGADCRVVLTKFELIVPRLIFNAEGKSMYMKDYLAPRKWTYLKELIHKQISTQQLSGNFRITTGVNRPRHVFVFIINDVSINSQTNKQTINSCITLSASLLIQEH